MTKNKERYEVRVEWNNRKHEVIPCKTKADINLFSSMIDNTVTAAYSHDTTNGNVTILK